MPGHLLNHAEHRVSVRMRHYVISLRRSTDRATTTCPPPPCSIPNWFYWCYNANSGDTGGLVDDMWRNLEWIKIDFLTTQLGLRAWYLYP